MLKRLLNECRFNLEIKPQGPILIKTGAAAVSGPDMCFVKTYRNGEMQPYLPGSSLKGVLRSHSERIINTINDGKACMPFEENGSYKFCGKKIEKLEKQKEKKLPKPDVYKMSCPVCRLFGSTSFVGRISISDAYTEKNKAPSEQRDGVGIDRYTGGAVRGAKFDLEPVTGGTFECSVYIRNFEIWQLGLIGCLLKDFKDGYIYLGSGKSRGLGKVEGELKDFEISFPGRPEIPDKLIPGVGYLMNGEGASYGYNKQTDFVKLEGEGIARENKGVRTVFTFTDNAYENLMEESIKIFFESMKA